MARKLIQRVERRTADADVNRFEPERKRSKNDRRATRTPTFPVAILAGLLLLAPVSASLPGGDSGAWVQTEKLTAHPVPDVRVAEDASERPLVQTGHDDWFGRSVAMDQGVVAVGAPRAHNQPVDEAGEVFVYDGEDPSLAGSARLSPGQANDNFGWSVALSENELVVGAPTWNGDSGEDGSAGGAAYVYESAGSDWTLSQVIDPEETVPDATVCFGASVAIDGDVLVVGAPCTEEAGAYVYERVNTGWHQVGTLTSPDSGWRFGTDVAVSGETALVGGITGPAQVFEPRDAGWSHSATLETPTSIAVDIEEDVALVGSLQLDEATVFRADGGGWEAVDVLQPPEDAFPGRSGFGASVAIASDANLLAVGASVDDPTPPGSPALPSIPVVSNELGQRGQQPGAVHLFTSDGAADGFQHAAKLVASDARSEWWNGEFFGASVGVDAAGTTVVAGAPRDACCDDPLNAGFLPPPAEGPCGLSTFACVHQASEPDAAYTFTNVAGVASGGDL